MCFQGNVLVYVRNRPRLLCVPELPAHTLRVAVPTPFAGFGTPMYDVMRFVGPADVAIVETHEYTIISGL